MKKNFFKKLAATLALAMVVTSVAPAATASAAAGITGAASTVYATKAYNLKLGKGVNAKWTSSNKAVATVGLTGGKLKANKAGKVTITAKSKNTGKTYKKTFVVKQRATSVDLGNDLSVAVGDSAQLKAELTPSTSTDVVRYFSDNKEVATVGMTGGKVTGKKAGEATITVYAKATTASSNASKMNKVDTIKVKVGTFIESAVQNSTTKLDVVFNADMKDAKLADFKIIKDDTNQNFAIRSLSVDGKKVTVETYSDINDGATYTVTYGENEYKFVATNGKVSTLAIGPATITYEKETEINLYAKDANGVIVKEFAYGEEDAEYDFDIDTKDGGYTTGTKLVLNEVGDTAKATATLHTYEYDTNGTETGVIKTELTITAVEKSDFVTSGYKYTVDDEAPDWDDFTQNTKLAIDDEDYYVYLQLKDADGDEVDTDDYSLTSSNDDVLIVNDDTDDNFIKAEIRAVDKGTAYVLVRNDDDKVVLSLQVTIVAEREPAGLVLSASSVNLSNAVGLNDDSTVDVELKDQFGDKMADSYVEAADIDVECISTSAEDGAGDDIDEDFVVDGSKYFDINNGEIVFYGDLVEEGTYSYKVTVDDFSKTVKVIVKTPGTDVDDESFKLLISKKSADIAFKDSDTDEIDIEMKVAVLNKGVVTRYIDVADYVSYDLEVDGDDVTSGTSISGTAFTLAALDIASTNVTKAETGNYTIKIKVTDADSNTVTLNGSFTLTDSQAGITVKRDEKTDINAGTFASAILEAFDFTYKGKDLEEDLGLSVSDITDVEVKGDYTTAEAGKTYSIKEVTMVVDVNGYDVPFTVEIGKSITIED